MSGEEELWREEQERLKIVRRWQYKGFRVVLFVF